METMNLYKSRIRTTSAILTFLALVLLLAIVAGCGGGTEGSGYVSVQGRVLSNDTLLPISNAEVTLTNTGESAITNSNGEFVIDSQQSLSEGTANFMIEIGSVVSTTFSVSEVPGGNADISLVVTIDTSANRAQVTEVQISGGNPSPQPRPTEISIPTAPAPTSVPNVTAVPTSPASPTNAPQPTMTSAPQSTRTPTPAPTQIIFTVCDADLDSTGIVNANDLVRAQSLFTDGNFDFNRDGQTTTADLILFQEVFQKFFGQTCE